MKKWRSQFLEWLKEICPGKNTEMYVQFSADSNPPSETRVHFYTHDFCYTIVAKNSSRKDWGAYLGCVVECRKPRAGEDWTRGRDLPDGEFNRKTWESIKDAILAYELIRIAKKERSWIDQEEKELIRE